LDIECNHCGGSFFLDEIYIDVNSEGGM